MFDSRYTRAPKVCLIPRKKSLTSELLTVANVNGLLESVLDSGHGKTLVSQSQQFNQAISKLRYQCELYLANCSLKRRKAPYEEAFGVNSQWKEALLAAWRAYYLAEDVTTDRVWAACAPWIPGNDKSAYSAVERSNARFCCGSILSELGYVFPASRRSISAAVPGFFIHHYPPPLPLSPPSLICCLISTGLWIR